MNENLLEIDDHVYEGELTSLPPRRVRLNGRALLVYVAALFLMAAFSTCGIATINEAYRVHLLAATGRNAVAHVTEIDYSSGQPATVDRSKWVNTNAPAVSSVKYAFVDNAKVAHIGRIPITLARSEAGMAAPTSFTMLPGEKFNVRYTLIGGKTISRPWSGSSAKKVGFLAAAGIGAIFVGILLAWRALRWVSRAYNLIRNGFVTTATVLGKEAKVEDAPRFYVAFGYTTHDGVMRQKRIQCTSSQYQKFLSGQNYTLIYPPSRPQDAALYMMLPFGR